MASGTAFVAEEPREVAVRIRHIGSILLAAATAFFFIAFLFAFLYLRALNSNGLWAGGKPGHHVPVPTGYGIAILVCVLLSVGAAWVGARRPALSLYGAAAGLALALAAIALQCASWANLGFGPGDGGYASVFLGWTGFFTVFLLGSAYWLETTIASAIRLRPAPADVAGELADFSFFFVTLGLVEIAAFVLLYGVK